KAQSIDSLKLTDSEIPAGYTKSNELLCKTPHALSLYQQMDMYESLLGKVEKKDFQSFAKKGDSGSILYFQFQNDFTGQGFLDGLFWGSDGKPSKSEPDEYFAKGNILVVWSFNFKSDLKSISKDKVEKILKSAK
ncbi:MAG TPA: hypothetical protein VFI33_05530, partial [Puia sp.]|nr:hypothetical protein [Puia sp.]